MRKKALGITTSMWLLVQMTVSLSSDGKRSENRDKLKQKKESITRRTDISQSSSLTESQREKCGSISIFFDFGLQIHSISAEHITSYCLDVNYFSIYCQ